MIKWIIGILIILDILFQVVGKSANSDWYIYRDLVYSVFAFSICIYFIHKPIMLIFSGYFLAVILISINQYIIQEPFFTDDPLYIGGFVALALLSIFSIKKLCLKK